MSDAFYPQYQLEIDKLRGQRGEPLLQQIQRVIEVATEHGDLDAAADWYQQLLKQASQQGRFDYELAAFASLRQLYEGHEKFKFLRATLLWYYKWVVERLPEHADISQELIDSTFAQMTQFYQAEGESLRPAYSLRCRCESFMGHKEKAAEYKELWEKTDSAKFDDCPACQTHARVQYLLDINQVDDAIAAAEPIFEGKEHCDEVPSATFSRLLLPMAGSGKVELAERMQRFTQRHVRKVPKMLSYLCNHVTYLSLTGRPSQANRLAAVMLVRGAAATNTYHCLCAWRAAWTWLAMRKNQGETSVRLPSAVFGPRAGMDIDEAIRWCREQSFDLAAKFDQRNGNQRFGEPLVAMEKAFSDLKPQ